MQKLLVIDYWSQYTHLITNRLRNLWVLTEIVPAQHNMTNEELFDLKSQISSWDLKWIILSWGPASVYDKNWLTLPKEFFDIWVPILAICYGHHLTHFKNWWNVKKWEVQEYWHSSLKLWNSRLFKWISKKEITVWMSHWDEVSEVWNWFKTTASTSDCLNWATENSEKNIFTLQFHPEVTHSEWGLEILKNFVEITEIKKEWSMEKFLKQELQEVKEKVWDKNVFLFISWWVDSTVAYFLLKEAIWTERIYPCFVDTGFMRKNERQKVEKLLKDAWVQNLNTVDASEDFISWLKEKYEPEEKRKIIWDLFIEIQKRVLKEMWMDENHWLLGQGTIYPDTIESWGTKNADTIKTHHNRVPEIEKMIKKWLIIEPISKLYKDEVREIWKLLNLSDEAVYRHPFPWPWLAVRILCNDQEKAENWFDFQEKEILDFVNRDFCRDNWDFCRDNSWIISTGKFNVKILPIKSVWVQWDNRTYKHPVSIWFYHSREGKNPEKNKNHFTWDYLNKISTSITNKFDSVNRVLLDCNSFVETHCNASLQDLCLKQAYSTQDRIDLLQEIDEIVEDFLIEKKYLRKIWQFPVVLLPLTSDWKKESIVLRPIDSKEAMTATFSHIDIKDLKPLVEKILKNPLVDTVFYDLTNKPPWTIEWE